MKLNREIAWGLVTLAVSLGLTLMLGEGAMRLITRRHLIYNIEMVKYAKELKMRDPFHEMSHVHRPNSSARLMGVDIRLNSWGQRGPEPLPKSETLKRVLVLGSSVTLGWGVPEESVFTSKTAGALNADYPEQSLARVSLLNAGIGNYNTYAQSRLFWREYPQLDPDMVILHYFISDVEPRSMGNNSFLLEHSLLADYLYNLVGIFSFKRKHISLADYYADLYKDDSPAWIKTQRYISEMNEVLKKDHRPFLVMIVPDFHNLKPGTPYGSDYEKIETTFRKLGIATLNTFPLFQKDYGSHEADLWIQPDDPHPNALGHDLMAKALVKYFHDFDPLHIRRMKRTRGLASDTTSSLRKRATTQPNGKL